MSKSANNGPDRHKSTTTKQNGHAKPTPGQAASTPQYPNASSITDQAELIQGLPLEQTLLQINRAQGNRHVFRLIQEVNARQADVQR